jgi:cell division protein FtsW (lipid II flippase)
MESILGAAQSLVNFLFLIIVLGTVGLSWWLSTKYRERYAEFPWNKAGIILAIEVLSWIAFNIFWSWVRHNWWIVAILVVIIVVVLMKRKS